MQAEMSEFFPLICMLLLSCSNIRFSEYNVLTSSEGFQKKVVMPLILHIYMQIL